MQAQVKKRKADGESALAIRDGQHTTAARPGFGIAATGGEGEPEQTR